MFLFGSLLVFENGMVVVVLWLVSCVVVWVFRFGSILCVEFIVFFYVCVMCFYSV